MKLRPVSWLSWQLSSLLVLTLVCGLAVGALVATTVYMAEAEPVARELGRKTSRIELLELMVQQEVPDTYAALDHSGQKAPDVPEAQAVVATGASGAGGAPRQPSPVAPPRSSAPVIRQARATPELPVGRAIVPKPAPQAVHASPAGPGVTVDPPVLAPAAAEGVSGEELLLAMKARIEGVPAEKAGVRSVEKGAVLLRNGSVVRVGQSFPSGEKLLQVDVENNRVVTSKRQMLLFFPN